MITTDEHFELILPFLKGLDHFKPLCNVNNKFLHLWMKMSFDLKIKKIYSKDGKLALKSSFSPKALKKKIKATRSDSHSHFLLYKKHKCECMMAPYSLHL